MSMTSKKRRSRWLALLSLITVGGCAGRHVTFHDPGMDFSLVQTVAVLPLANLTPNTNAAFRVADVITTLLQATGSMYVLPPGEVNQAITRVKVVNPTAPTAQEAVTLAAALKADALFTGTVLEYGEVRASTASGNIISVSLKMMESQTGRVVWTAASSQGGVGAKARLLGSGVKPMDEVTQKAVEDLLNKLFLVKQAGSSGKQAQGKKE